MNLSRSFASLRFVLPMLVFATWADGASAQVDPVAARVLAEKNLCFTCHHLADRHVGPAFKDVAERYRSDSGARAALKAKLKAGGKGIWGNVPMPSHPQMPDADTDTLLRWILAMAASPEALAASDTLARAIVAQRCSLCHGLEGEGTNPATPRLAAQNSDYMAKQLLDFQQKRRQSTTMLPIAADLREAEIRSISAYYSSKPGIVNRNADAELAAVGKFLFLRGNPYAGTPPCAQCHGTNGHGTSKLPRLAGQQAEYVEAQLRRFAGGQRANDSAVMQAVTHKLSELEIKAIAEYVGTLI